LYLQAKVRVQLGAGHGGIEAALSLCKSSEINYRRALSLDPSCTEAHYNLGNVLFEIAGMSEDVGEGAEFYSRAVEEYENAYEGGIELVNTDALVNCGVCLLKLASAGMEEDEAQSLKLFDLAFDKFKAAIKLDPSRGDAWLNLGVGLSDRASLSKDTVGTVGALDAGHMYLDACEKFAKALSVDPKCFNALFNWGNTLIRHAVQLPPGEHVMSALTNAGDKFSLFVQANPGHTPALINWAVSLYKLGCMRLQIADTKGTSDNVLQAEEVFKTAEAKLRQVLSIQPEEVEAIIKLGLVLTARGNFRSKLHESSTLFLAANECYRKAAYLKPRHAATFANWGLLYHTIANNGQDGDLALSTYRSACKRHREASDLGSRDALLHWGHTLMACSNIVGLEVTTIREYVFDAQQKYKAAIDANPCDQFAVQCVGDSYFALAELADTEETRAALFGMAAKQYLKAVEISPSMIISRVNMLPPQHRKGLVPEIEPSAAGSSGGMPPSTVTSEQSDVD